VDTISMASGFPVFSSSLHPRYGRLPAGAAVSTFLKLENAW